MLQNRIRFRVASFPLPGPSEIILFARRFVSSIGGYTVGGIFNLNFRDLFGCQSTVFDPLDNLFNFRGSILSRKHGIIYLSHQLSQSAEVFMPLA